ncbi:MAG: protein-glutamate O-methyltransferase CheR [Chloroflexota bacterium]
MMPKSDKSLLDGDSEERAFEAILAYVHRERRLDCSQYKDSFLRRRLAVRLRACEVYTCGEYLEVLRSSPSEINAFLTTITINLSYFFRDGAAFGALHNAVLAVLIARRSQTRRLRLTVWSAGCAGGEEPYSVAMILADLLGPALPSWDVKIHATDLDEAALMHARRGVYKAFSFSPSGGQADFVERYFTQIGDNYAVLPMIRQMVTFQQHDLAKPPPLPSYDLILCRNVLIYFTRQHQKRIIQHLLDHLEPGGCLMLGMAEMLPLAFSSQLKAVDGRLRIYRKSESASRRVGESASLLRSEK